MHTLLIYTNVTNSKFQYVLDFIFSESLSCIVELTSDLNFFKKKSGCLKLCYGNHNIENAISVPTSEYFESFSTNNIPSFDENFIKNGVCTFDLFAAAFFLLARVEEYGDYTKDIHGRFPARASILYEKGFLEKPIVDIWIEQLRIEFEKKNRVKLERNSKFEFYSTIDIDHIFAFAKKPLLTKIGAFTKDLFAFNFQRLKDRFNDIDPYDTFQFIRNLHNQLGLQLHSFILTSERSKYDKTLNPDHRCFEEKVSVLAEYGRVGIHPSYYSSSKDEGIKSEKEHLEKILKNKITSSRQHFVKLEFPSTYQSLIEAGICEDYSMGYPDHSGFRAGTSKSFSWYDIEKDVVSSLKVFPFQLMDVTLKNYERLTPSQAIDKAKTIIHNTQDVGGTCCLIWHNSSFYETEGWKGWDEVYKNILSMANLKNNNTLDTK